MKRTPILAGVIVLILGTAGSTAALQFTDEVIQGFDQPFVFSEDNPSVGYRHDITDNGFDPDPEKNMILTSASLDIRFWGIEEIDSSFSAAILGFNSTLTAYADGPAHVPTPEPASIILFGIGLIGFALYQKKHQKRSHTR